MPIKTIFAVIALTLSPSLSLAQCVHGEATKIKMTCADTMVFDGKTQSCVPVTG